jgi:two-component system, OmpR family, osmolarity sensor histidine kinase EnvZ
MPSQNDSDVALRGLAHDLNNIFQVILCAADTMTADPAHAAAFSVIARAVAQANRIIRHDAQQPQDLNLKEVVERCSRFAADFSSVSGGPEVQTIVNLPPAANVLATPAALERTLMNLLLNAVEAGMRAGRNPIVIHIEASPTQDHLTVRVRDNGPGLPPSPLENAPGLGLRIVQQNVRLDGGTFTMANAPSGGAVFTLTLQPIGSGRQASNQTQIASA